MSTQSVAQHKLEPVDEFLFNFLKLVLTLAFCIFVFFGIVFAFKALFPSLTMAGSYFAAFGSVLFLAVVVIIKSIKEKIF